MLSTPHVESEMCVDVRRRDVVKYCFTKPQNLIHHDSEAGSQDATLCPARLPGHDTVSSTPGHSAQKTLEGLEAVLQLVEHGVQHASQEAFPQVAKRRIRPTVGP